MLRRTLVTVAAVLAAGAAQAQQKEIDALRAELKEQKVNDKVELSKAEPQTVLNNR